MSTRTLAALVVTLVGVATALVVTLPAAAAGQQDPTYVLDTARNEINPGTFNQGWWSTNTTNSDSNANYETGRNEDGDILRNFFTFDITGIGNACAPYAATLQMAIGYGNQAAFGLGPTTLTYQLFDVSTSAVALNDKSANPNSAIYADLGSGTMYASEIYATTYPSPFSTIAIPLNAAALNALGAAKKSGSQFFSIGGAIMPPPASNYSFLFGYTYTAVSLTASYPRLCKVYP
jgi:hypothetical protein